MGHTEAADSPAYESVFEVSELSFCRFRAAMPDLHVCTRRDGKVIDSPSDGVCWKEAEQQSLDTPKVTADDLLDSPYERRADGHDDRWALEAAAKGVAARPPQDPSPRPPSGGGVDLSELGPNSTPPPESLAGEGVDVAADVAEPGQEDRHVTASPAGWPSPYQRLLGEENAVCRRCSRPIRRYPLSGREWISNGQLRDSYRWGTWTHISTDREACRTGQVG